MIEREINTNWEENKAVKRRLPGGLEAEKKVRKKNLELIGTPSQKRHDGDRKAGKTPF